MGFQQEDFSSNELARIKYALSNYDVRLVKTILEKHSEILEIPVNRLFIFYLAVHYRNKEIFDHIIESSDMSLSKPSN